MRCESPSKWLVLSFCMLTEFYSLCLAENSLEDVVPKEAVDAWHQIATSPDEFTLAISHARWDTKGVTRESEKYARSQYGRLVIYEEPDKSICFLRNEHGRFVLERAKAQTGSWNLVEAIGHGEEGIDELSEPTHRFLMAPAIQLYSGYTLDDCVNYASIRWSNWKEFVEHGERMASFEMVIPQTIVRESDQRRISTGRYEITVLVDRNYAIHHARKFRLQENEPVVEIAYEYSDVLPKTIPAKWVRDTHFDDGDARMEFNTEHVSFEPVPKDRFELSTYGVGEVAIARNDRSVRFYLACFVIGLTFLALYSWTRKRTS